MSNPPGQLQKSLGLVSKAWWFLPSWDKGDVLSKELLDLPITPPPQPVPGAKETGKSKSQESTRCSGSRVHQRSPSKVFTWPRGLCPKPVCFLIPTRWGDQSFHREAEGGTCQGRRACVTGLSLMDSGPSARQEARVSVAASGISQRLKEVPILGKDLHLGGRRGRIEI